MNIFKFFKLQCLKHTNQAIWGYHILKGDNPYEENIISIIKGVGSITSPSYNTVKSHLITPKTVLVFEQVYLDMEHQSFNSLATEYRVSPATVSYYKGIYLELRHSGRLEQRAIEEYLWNNGIDYPLPQLLTLEDTSNPMKLDTLLQQQAQILQNQAKLIESQQSIHRDNMKLATKLDALDNSKMEKDISVMAEVIQRLVELQRKVIKEETPLHMNETKLSKEANQAAMIEPSVRKVASTTNNFIPNASEPVTMVDKQGSDIGYSISELVSNVYKYISTVTQLHDYYIDISNRTHTKKEFNQYWNSRSREIADLVYDNIDDMKQQMGNVKLYADKVQLLTK